MNYGFMFLIFLLMYLRVHDTPPSLHPHTHQHTQACAYAHTYLRMSARTRTQACVYAHTHTHTHTQIHFTLARTHAKRGYTFFIIGFPISLRKAGRPPYPLRKYCTKHQRRVNSCQTFKHILSFLR